MVISDLPPELLAAILLRLDSLQDFLRCREVSTLFKDLIDHDARAQYKIELAVAGMEDGPPSALTASDRLAILHARQEAWSKLQWRSKQDVDLLDGGLWELYGGVLAQTRGNSTLVFIQLPSAIRGIEGKEWTIPDIGVKIRDFAMDPAQDLLVIIENHHAGSDPVCHAHLRSLTTGTRHPAALESGMVTYSEQRGRYSYTIQTSEDLLGVLSSSSEGDKSDLLIWNWKTGALRLHIIGPETSSFTFLTARYILLTVIPDLDLDLQGGDATAGASGHHLLVLDLDTCHEDSGPVGLADLSSRYTFHYPELDDMFRPVIMRVHTDPAPYWCPHPTLKVPFSVSHADRLLVVTTWLITPHHREIGLLSLFPASTLLAAIAALPPGTTGHEFAWADWGPAGSRLIVAPPSFSRVWVCYVYGMSFVMALRETTHTRVVFRLDFNQLDIRRGLRELERGDESGEGRYAGSMVVKDMVPFSPRRVFKEEVLTGLPYCLRKTSAEDAAGEGHYTAVMVSEDSLVLVYSQPHMRKYRILTF